MVNWLITGGCGFIGRALIKSLIAEGSCSIRVFDNLSVGTLDELKECGQVEEISGQSAFNVEKIQLLSGDIRDENNCLIAVHDADVIVHLAANTGVGPSVEEPRLDCTTNVIGTFNMLEAARVNSVKRFIFASSGAPVGEVEPPIHEELAPHPVSPYGASKLAGEGYCSAYFRTYGVETVALRFGNVYGPGSAKKESVVAKFIKLAMQGEDLEIYGDGSQTRDYIYIEDLVRAIELAATQKGVGGEVFQIATNTETTLNELVDILIPCLHSKGIKEFKVKYGESRLGDVMRNYSDTSKAKEKLGWQNKYSLEDGLGKTIEYFFKKL